MKRFILFSVLLLTPCLTLAQGFGGSAPSWLRLLSESGGTLTLSGNLVATNVSATSYTATAASGSIGIQGVTNQKWCLGTGGTLCLFANGVTIQTTSYFSSTGGIITPIFSSYGLGSLTLNSGVESASDAYSFRFKSAAALTHAGAVIAEFYSDNAVTKVATIDKDGAYGMDGTDESGTPGAATINQPAGRVAVAAAASTVVVTNAIVTVDSIIVPVVETIDATCTYARVTPAAGSFTITMEAACTANTDVSFVVHPMF
jgi:hypothetical protein